MEYDVDVDKRAGCVGLEISISEDVTTQSCSYKLVVSVLYDTTHDKAGAHGMGLRGIPKARHGLLMRCTPTSESRPECTLHTSGMLANCEVANQFTKICHRYVTAAF